MDQSNLSTYQVKLMSLKMADGDLDKAMEIYEWLIIELAPTEEDKPKAEIVPFN